MSQTRELNRKVRNESLTWQGVRPSGDKSVEKTTALNEVKLAR